MWATRSEGWAGIDSEKCDGARGAYGYNGLHFAKYGAIYSLSPALNWFHGPDSVGQFFSSTNKNDGEFVIGNQVRLLKICLVQKCFMKEVTDSPF